MKKILLFALALTLIACFGGCRALQEAYDADMGFAADTDASDNAPGTAEFDASLADNNGSEKYINTALGFTATIPEGWVFATDEDTGELNDLIQNYFIGTEVSINTQNILMVCSQYHNSNYNPTILVEAFSYQEIDFEIQRDYMQRSYEETYAQGGVASVDVSGTPSCVINDTEYMLFTAAVQFDTFILYQNQYYVALGDYWVVFTQTYYTNAQKEIMDAFMQNLVYTSAA